nr:hypothetical protein BaRGS_027552 [Batillaria attramentaria]
MLSAAELQKETEAAVQAERKARLQQDIIECHRDLQLTAMHGEGSVDKWAVVEEGVKNPDLTDAAVGILDTYIGAVDGDVFWMSLRRCCEKFVKEAKEKNVPFIYSEMKGKVLESEVDTSK